MSRDDSSTIENLDNDGDDEIVRENTGKSPGSFSTDSVSLEETLRLLSRVIAAAVTSIVVTDPSQPDNPIVFHNPAFERISGYTASEIDGHNCRFLQGPDTDRAVVAEIRAALREERTCDVILQNYRKDGTPFWNHLTISPVRDSRGKVTHFVGVQSDVTLRKEAEQERDVLLKQQQRIAETLQRALLLDPPAAFQGLEISTEYAPAWDEAQFGGDFFDAFALNENMVALVVGDVTGKGLHAAQYTAEVKYALRVLLREYANPLPALSRLNSFLIEAQRLDGRDAYSLVCVVLAVLNTETGEVSITSAGMESPLIVRKDGTVEEVPVDGMMIGIDNDAVYKATRRTLERGDVLLMVTDGITEARRGNEFLGVEGLGEVALRAASRETLSEMGKEIAAHAQEFAGGKQMDDVCLLLARRREIH